MLLTWTVCLLGITGPLGNHSTQNLPRAQLMSLIYGTFPIIRHTQSVLYSYHNSET